MVQLLLGPVEGLVSQNCVCKSSPPGDSKQHVLDAAEVFWHEVGPEVEQPELIDVSLEKILKGRRGVKRSGSMVKPVASPAKRIRDSIGCVHDF